MEISKKKIIYNGVGLPVCEKLEDIYTIDSPDYWTRLEHQYVGMAMQGLCANSGWDNVAWKDMAEDAISAAHALVEELKSSDL